MQQQGTKHFIFLITLIAAIGGFLFGFDMAVVSGIIEPIKQQFGLSASQEGLFVSCALLGCIIGVGFSGYLSDKIGRKKFYLLLPYYFLSVQSVFRFLNNIPCSFSLGLWQVWALVLLPIFHRCIFLK